MTDKVNLEIVAKDAETGEVVYRGEFFEVPYEELILPGFKTPGSVAIADYLLRHT